MKVIITLRCCTQLSFFRKGRVLGSRKWPIVLGMNKCETLLLAKNQVPNMSKKKKKCLRSSCLFNTINHKGYIQFTVIGALQLAIHVEQTVVQESRSRTETRQTKGNLILNGNFLCLSCPSATFALQLGGFVPRDQLASKGLL